MLYTFYTSLLHLKYLPKQMYSSSYYKNLHISKYFVVEDYLKFRMGMWIRVKFHFKVFFVVKLLEKFNV